MHRSPNLFTLRCGYRRTAVRLNLHRSAFFEGVHARAIHLFKGRELSPYKIIHLMITETGDDNDSL